MLYGLYLSAGGLKAQEMRQNVLSNNIANAGTVGFKRDLIAFQARENAVFEDPRMAGFRTSPFDHMGGGVTPVSAGVDLEQGALQHSANPTDLALEGKGFFRVRGDDGQTLLTRNGQFVIDADGNLLTFNDHRPILSQTGQPIRVNPNIPFQISRSGAITQGDGNAIQIGLADVSDPRMLKKLGKNYLSADANTITAIDPKSNVHQNMIESSSVNPIVEMVTMMQGQRIFDANARLISMQDQTLQQLNSIGRIA